MGSEKGEVMGLRPSPLGHNFAVAADTLEVCVCYGYNKQATHL